MVANKEKLNYGIMCGGTQFQDWQAQCIQKLNAVEGVNLKLLIIDDSKSPSGLRGELSPFFEYRQRTNFRAAFNKYTWKLYRRRFVDPSSKDSVDLSDELSSVDRIKCEVIEDGFGQHFDQSDIETVKEYDLDFILRFGFGIIRGEMLNVPTYGIWSFHHGDERKYRGGPACFWEIYNEDPVTGAILQRLTEDLDKGIILKRGFFPTNSISYEKNMDNVIYGSAEWPAQVATDLLNGDSDYISAEPSQSDAPIYRSPSPLQIVAYNGKRAKEFGETVTSGSLNWTIGVLDASPKDLIANDSYTISDIDVFHGNKQDGFIADPFPIKIDDDHYIFLEEFSYSDNKGKISYMKYPDDFHSGRLRTAHEEPFHLSYPFLIKNDNEIYAIPETYLKEEIRLYQLNSPNDWELEDTLVSDIKAVDPTVVYFDGTWWLFFTERDYSNTKLHLWYADSLTGSWNPHENNPIKTDVRSARPGGTPFIHDDVLYRPAQNRGKNNGKSVILNKIDSISPNTYSERIQTRIQLAENSNYSGLHTLSENNGLCLVDCENEVWNFNAIRNNMRKITNTLGY